MSNPSFGGKSSAPSAPAPAASVDQEFKALLRDAKAEVEASAADKATKVDASSVDRARPKFHIGREIYIYLVAAALWFAGVYWMSTQAAPPGALELALTQAPVAGLVLAVQLFKKRNKA